MRTSPLPLFTMALIMLLSLPSLAQDVDAIQMDQFFIKLTDAAFDPAQRNDANHVLAISEIATALSKERVTRIEKAFPSMSTIADPYGLQRVFVIGIEPGSTLESTLIQLNDIRDIEYAEPMYIRELYESQLIPDDPYYPQSWHHPVVNTPDAWDIQTGSDTIIVAIIDTGVDTDHPDLYQNLWNNPGELANNGIDDDFNGHIDDIFGWDFTQNDNDVNHEWNWHPYNSEDHGTHCAGIAAGVTNNGVGIAGASHNSKIMTCKIFPYVSDAAAANAILYAANNGAHVISNSWGGGGSSNTIQSAILHARNVRDAIVLFAAGNDGSSSAHYPGAEEGVICVGATNSSDARASFSNYGSWVDMCAPGTGIWSCTDRDNPAHDTRYQAWDGTSMATPLAAGIAALIRSQFPNMGVADVESRLLDGDDVGNLQMGLRVNALSALTAFNINHTPIYNISDPTTSISISAEIFAEESAEITVSVFYGINGSTMTSLPMPAVSPGVYSVEIPAQTGGTIVQYYIQAADNAGSQVYHPFSAPTIPHFFTVGGLGYFNTLVYDDAETEQGWTLGLAEDNATSGTWVREDPIGTLDDGDVVQPEDDHSDPGTLCFVTGNAPFSGSNGGDADVDGGQTTLQSPIYGVPPGASPIISYYRWYSNDRGFNPSSDNWQVLLAVDGGEWLTLENTKLSSNAWVEGRFLLSDYVDQASFIQLRFIADDSGDGSLVEAAVDDLRIYYAGEVSFIPGDVNMDAQINVQDLVLLVSHILGNSSLVGNGVFAADLNQDGDINIQDIVNLVDRILE